jgi:hypothetical protein
MAIGSWSSKEKNKRLIENGKIPRTSTWPEAQNRWRPTKGMAKILNLIQEIQGSTGVRLIFKQIQAEAKSEMALLRQWTKT